MIVTATELANDSKAILDRVIGGGERVEVKRHGKTVAEITPKHGVSRRELLRVLDGADLGEEARRSIQSAINAASEIVGHAGCD